MVVYENILNPALPHADEVQNLTATCLLIREARHTVCTLARLFPTLQYLQKDVLCYISMNPRKNYSIDTTVTPLS